MPSPAAFSTDVQLDSCEEFTRRSRRNALADRPAGRDSCLQELKGKVRTALVKSGYAALDFIRCDVEANRVILYGKVPSYHMKQLAQVFVQRVDGVGRVENRLAVERRRPA